jgi:hypothetical protein
VDFLRWPMMYNKMFPINSICSPKDGPTIWLWKFDNQGCPKLPNGIWKLVFFHPICGDDALKSIEKEKFINSGVSKYLKFGKSNILKDEMYVRVMKPYIEYWEGILECLSKPIAQ